MAKTSKLAIASLILAVSAAFSAKGDGSDGWFNDKIGCVPADPANDGNIWNPAG